VTQVVIDLAPAAVLTGADTSTGKRRPALANAEGERDTCGLDKLGVTGSSQYRPFALAK
jgi:hypothetical protein